MEDAAIIAPHFQDPDKAREFMEARRWPNGPECPHCGIVNEAYRLEQDLSRKSKGHGRKGLWKCKACGEQFTITVGTIMEDSHIPLNKWLWAFHLLCSSKKGISAHQMHRMIGITYKSAWFMMHRVRYAMTQEPLSSKLDGIVEIDEAYIGGKRRKKNQKIGTPEQEQERRFAKSHEQNPSKGHSPFEGKATVVALVQRGGRVHSVHLPGERVTGEKPQADLGSDGSRVLT